MKNCSRRVFLSVASVTPVAGCISTSENSSSPDRCELDSRKQQGRGDAIETTVELQSGENPERKSFAEPLETDNASAGSEESARAAAEIAFRDVANEFDVEQSDEPPKWVYPAIYTSGPKMTPTVVVRALKYSDSAAVSAYNFCPPETYDFSRAIETVPRTITVTVASTDDEQVHTQAHDVHIQQQTSYFE